MSELIIIPSGFKGDTDASSETLDVYSEDTSIFKITPSLVIYPKDN